MEKLRIIDTSLPVTVKPVVDNEDTAAPVQDQPAYYYLIMGPTGVGKSSFIEALAGESCNFSISKDQLSGYTQHVTDYALINVTTSNGNPIHIIDTPGFADTNISELEVITMINEWISKKGMVLRGVDHLFFLTPITETRLAGSKRRTIAMIHEFVETWAAPNSVTFVTTMWDTLHGQRNRDRAENNFEELCRKDGILKDFPYAQVVRFMNTQTSALDVIGPANRRGFVFDNSQPDLNKSSHLYHDLYQRIECALQERKTIKFDLMQTQSESKPNAQLVALLERNCIANDKILTKFSKQFALMEEPPSDFGLGDAYRHLKEEIRVLESETLTSGPDASPTSAPSTHSSTNIQPDDLVAEPCSEPHDSAQPQPKASYLKNIPEAPDSNAATAPQPKASRLLALRRLVLRFIADAQVRGKRLFRMKA